MGIYSRDYYRDLTPSPWSFERTPVVKLVIAINVVIYLALVLYVRPPVVPEEARHMKDDSDQALTERQLFELMRTMRPVSVIQEWLELDTNKVVREGQVWRLITHAFCHDRLSVFHILINMFLLFWFGRTLELMYGSREFLLFYLTAAVVAGLAFIALDLYTGSRIPAVGASGAVMAVMMLYTMHFPCETVCVCWFIPLEMRWLMVLFVIWDLHPILLTLAGDQVFTGVGHAAHLGGL
ncbi:MAG TPA: rhomboid family intramembrane serine protease, partial [Urbifossiella sp.]